MVRISQEKLAEALGLTFQQIQKYEKGVNQIGAITIRTTPAHCCAREGTRGR